jgi:hypothetical protein
MRSFGFLVAAVLLAAADPGAEAQQPAPIPGGTGVQMQPAPVPAGTGAPLACAGPKVCVREMKATTKVVRGSECKDFCVPRSFLVDFMRSCMGKGGCADGDCGNVHTKSVLMKKTVPGPDKAVCTLKELPVQVQVLPIPVPGDSSLSK